MIWVYRCLYLPGCDPSVGHQLKAGPGGESPDIGFPAFERAL